MQIWIACTLNTLNCPRVLVMGPRTNHFLFRDLQMQFFHIFYWLSFSVSVRMSDMLETEVATLRNQHIDVSHASCVNLPMSSCSPLMNPQKQLLFFLCFVLFCSCNAKQYFHNKFFFKRTNYVLFQSFGLY